jgi:hypothetical protein
MFSAFECFMICSPAQPISLVYWSLSSVWYGNIALSQCMLCINRLRVSCWFDDVDYIRCRSLQWNTVTFSSEDLE